MGVPKRIWGTRGMRVNGPQMLALQRRQYNYGLIILDFVGSGSRHQSSIVLERSVALTP